MLYFHLMLRGVTNIYNFLFRKFVENHDHVIFADIKSVGNSLYVWTPTGQ